MKHISLNKKLMLRNLKKFSNVNLFEEKFKDKLNNTMSFNLSHKEKNNINLPYLNSTTTNYSSMITNNDNNTIYRNKRYKKNTSNNTTITFYITETNNNNNNNNNINNNSDKNLINNISFLLKCEEEAKKRRFKKKFELMELKISKLKTKKDNIKNYINKTNSIKLLNYKNKMNIEAIQKIKENYENKVENLNNIFTNLNIYKDLFKEKFLNKFNEYVRFLNTKKEIERETNEKLLSVIIHKKNEKNNIENQIKKLENEKNNILKWIFFQIQILEKKKNLENYYKLIIEESNEGYKRLLEKKNNNKENSIRQEKIENSRTSILNIGRRFSSFSQMSKGIKRKASKRFSIDQNLIAIRNISNEEMNKIRSYRIGLIYQTPEAFMDAMNNLYNVNIKYMNKYDELKIELFELNKEKNILKNEIEKKNEYENKQILLKEKELEDVLKKYDLLKNKKISIKKEFESNYKNNITSKKLINLIIQLYQTLDQLNLEDNLEENKKICSDEELALNYLEAIELKVVYILSLFKNVYSDIYYLVSYKIIKAKIDFKHKCEYSKKLKNDYIKKILMLRKVVEERNNKLIFKPRKKVDYHSIYIMKKKDKKDNKKDKITDNFEDFMYDINDYNKNNIKY
jgi:hypothetical protein